MASSSKMKNLASEVNSARNKLDGVLQTLMDKADDSTTEDSSEDEANGFTSEVAMKEQSVALTPSKRSTKVARKRRRKDDVCGKDSSNGNFTYVMKLFDRSVDLAKFSESTPLYPICRAWMLNEPQNGVVLKTESATSNIEEDTHSQLDELIDEDQYVTELPSPLKVAKTEDGSYNDMRIPSPLPPADPLNTSTNPDDLPSKEALLSYHMPRWKEIRQRWRDASFLNEERYKDSLAIIKSLKVVFE